MAASSRKRKSSESSLLFSSPMIPRPPVDMRRASAHRTEVLTTPGLDRSEKVGTTSEPTSGTSTESMHELIAE